MRTPPITGSPIRSFAHKAGRILLISMACLLAGILGLVGLLLLWSYPGKPEPFVDQTGNPLPDSISEKIYVRVNGVEQGMIIKGKDVRNPVLLYLHGGMPDYFLTRKYPTGLEDYFTVVWWEQRGSGMSYRTDTPPPTVEQLLSDTLEVTKYARQRFGKDRIYLMGHSGGTFIGIQAAARAPELYHAYIGVAQMSNQLTSEKLAYDYMLQQFKENGNARMVQKLEVAPVTLTGGTPETYLAVRDEAMHSLGIGTTHDMRSIMRGLFVPSWQSRDYTVGEKVNTWRAKAAAGVSVVWDAALATDLTQQVPKLDIPVYFFSGRYDYTVNYSLAKDYFERLKAPLKGFYTFEQSAHSPLFEEPDNVRKIVQEDILVGANRLADAK